MRARNEMVAILHNIRSIYNVASIFRTADGAGVSKIYLCGITPTPLDQFGKPLSQFSKVSLGAEQYVWWKKVVSTFSLIKKLKKEGYDILAVEQSKKSIPYFKLHKSYVFNHKVALILGNEVSGISLSILKHADHILEIPMHGKKESLNVSVAFGIAAYQLSIMRI